MGGPFVHLWRSFEAGHRRPAMGAVHRHSGRLAVEKIEAPSGRRPALVLRAPGRDYHLFDARVVDLIGDSLILTGFERAPDGAWVVQQWWLELG